jgi:hypothetical protein
MRKTNSLRVLVALLGMAASLLAFGVKPVQAAVMVGDNAVWARVYDLQNSPVRCSVVANSNWSCSTPSTSPLVANGADCAQTVYVDVASTNISVPLAGCAAQLSNVFWSGTAVCTPTAGCQGEAPVGSATFNFQPVVGSPILPQPATITDATCTTAGGHANVASNGVAGGATYAMTGTITWVGSCTDTVTALTWAGQVTIV